jgi:hypothetical protein
MKAQVAVQRTTDAAVLEENYRRTPTVLGHQLVDLLRAATVPAAPVVVAALLLMVMLAAEAAAAGAPHTGLAGEPVAEAIAEATTPTTELKKYDARSPPWQAKMTASLPSLLDFAIYFSQKNLSLLGSPSTM